LRRRMKNAAGVRRDVFFRFGSLPLVRFFVVDECHAEGRSVRETSGGRERQERNFGGGLLPSSPELAGGNAALAVVSSVSVPA
jgi:hypothetical protein